MSATRLAALRQWLADRDLDGFLVPKADEFQNEELPASSERLAWLTGFTGSAGTAIVLKDKAVLFVDGRYTLQAANQVDASDFEIVNVAEQMPSAWLAGNLPAGARFAYDPWLTTVAEAKRLNESCEKAGATLTTAEANPIDVLWTNRPEAPMGKVALHPAEFAGQSTEDKLTALATALNEAGAETAVLAQAPSIAWTFNIRGGDTGHTPVALAFALVHADRRPELFIDGRKLGNAERAALEEQIDISDIGAFADALGKLEGRKVLVEGATTAQAISDAIVNGGGKVVDGKDPITLPKARKNATELAGARAAQRRDGAAMVRFLAWLDSEAPKGGLDEIAAAEQLKTFRAETAEKDGARFVSPSFDTISGAGPNGAIVHYRVTPETSRTLEMGNLYLVDSGGQYPDGTTDITRTVAIGEPTQEMRDRYTRVLKGHIAISRAVFPEGTSGAQLDTLARAALWQAGLDYGHGTGHGVGAFLSVHEGPCNISKRGNTPLEAGMILSNEPGYYKEGEYGIRIENLVVVEPAESVDGGEIAVHTFETLTFCPYDRRLIETSLLDAGEIAWVNAYQVGLPEKLGGLLNADEMAWLEQACQPLGA